MPKEKSKVREVNKGSLTKALAVVGTIFACLPICMMILTGIAISSRIGRLRFDYLMPAELAPIAYVGAILLFWAAMRARHSVKIIVGLVIASVVFIVGGQTFAVITGLASGEREAEGFLFVILIISIVLFTIAQIGIAVVGVLLTRNIYSKKVRSS